MLSPRSLEGRSEHVYDAEISEIVQEMYASETAILYVTLE